MPQLNYISKYTRREINYIIVQSFKSRKTLAHNNSFCLNAILMIPFNVKNITIKVTMWELRIE